MKLSRGPALAVSFPKIRFLANADQSNSSPVEYDDVSFQNLEKLRHFLGRRYDQSRLSLCAFQKSIGKALIGKTTKSDLRQQQKQLMEHYADFMRAQDALIALQRAMIDWSEHPLYVTLETVRKIWDNNIHTWIKAMSAQGDVYRSHFLGKPFSKLIGTLRPEMKILDAGCGEGWLARLFAMKGGRQITGVDSSSETVKVAQSRTKQLLSPSQAKEIRYEVGSFTHLDIPSNTFDIVGASMSLMDCPLLTSPLHEFHRILKPKGNLYFMIKHPFTLCHQNDAIQYVSPTNIEVRFPQGYFEQSLFMKNVKLPSLPGSQVEHEIPTIHFPRPLSAYVNKLLEEGFRIIKMDEPKPSSKAFTAYPILFRWTLLPFSIMVHAQKGEQKMQAPTLKLPESAIFNNLETPMALCKKRTRTIEITSFHDLKKLPTSSQESVILKGLFKDAPSLKKLLGELGRVLKPGGEILLAVKHPFTDAQVGKIHHNQRQKGDYSFVLNQSYYASRHLKAMDYVNSFLTQFELATLEEPVPSERLCKKLPALRQWITAPYCLILSGRKTET